MRTRLKSYATLIGRARAALRRRGERSMEHLDLGLFQVDIRL